jgi:uncharacterized protein (DUF433 family)
MTHSPEVKHPHVERVRGRCGGEPVIRGTRFPVRSVVDYVYQQGLLPEQMVREWKELSLAAVHDALSYYHDNKPLIEEVRRRHLEAASLKKRAR